MFVRFITIQHGQLWLETALRDREEDRHAEAVSAQAGRVPAKPPCLGAVVAHPGPIREQVYRAAERDRRLYATETADH